jgi:hypothetical protein
MNAAIMNHNPQQRNQSKGTGASRGLKARRKAKRFITRTEARKQAARHVLKWMFRSATVRDGAEARLGIYLRPGWTPNDVWVVYKNPDEPLELKSSSIVIVCKRTGRELYDGSAGDEG